MVDEDLDLDMTFEQAAEFLERAGSTASTELLLEMLRECLEAIEGLSSRILSLELDRRSDLNVPKTVTGTTTPNWGGQIYNANQTSSSTPTVHDLMVRLNAVNNSVSS